ncbi:MAG: pectinesterase family protein [Christensenellaceae bacterium]
MSSYHLTETDVLQDVVDKAVSGDTLYLFPKTYNEKIEIKKDGLKLVGIKGKTVVSYCDCAKKPHPINYESNTFSSYTVGVFAKDVSISDLEIVNSAKNPQSSGQAVALTVYGDNFAMQGCKLSALQDTLFLGPLPDDLIARYEGFLPDYQRYYEGSITARFTDVEILGSVDFIFGSATAIFNDCKIKYVADGRDTGYIAAPSHSLKQKDGFIFYRCSFINDTDKEVYLARPWRDYGKCSFIDCVYRNLSPKTFDGWGNSMRYKTARFEMDVIPEKSVSWAKRIDKSDCLRLKSYVEKI